MKILNIVILTIFHVVKTQIQTETFTNPSGNIRRTLRSPLREYSVKIHQPIDTITTIRISHISFQDCKMNSDECCSRNYLKINIQKFCPKEINSPILISQRNPTTEINLKFTKEVKLWFEYSTRSTSQCQNFEFQCPITENCYNSTEICDGKFDCLDHSDEKGCWNCAPSYTRCSHHQPICFGMHQRCDGILDCPKGEDEENCWRHCNNSISCGNPTNTCVDSRKICDGNSDCPNDFDEENCIKQHCKPPLYFLCKNGICIDSIHVGNSRNECGDFSDEHSLFQMFLTGFMAIFLLILAGCFSGLLFKWCKSRRDIHRLIQNLPEFPLPPFQSPDGEDNEELNFGYSDSDFRTGGDIYEAFARTRRGGTDNNNNNGGNKEGSTIESTNTTTRHGDGSTNSENIDEEFELIKALISLSLPYEKCVELHDYFTNIDGKLSKI